MRRRFSIGILAAILTIIGSDSSPADQSWASCAAAPTRGCVLDWALEISRESGGWRVSALTAIVKAEAAAGRMPQVTAKTDEAVQVLDAMHEDGRRRAAVFGDLAAAHSRAGLTEKAHAIVGRALEAVESSDEADVFKEGTLSEIAKGQAGAGNIEEALRVSALIRGKGAQVNVIGAIAREEAKAGRFAEALKLAGTIAHNDTGEVLKSIADEQARSGLGKEARGTLAEAARLASSRTLLIDGGRVKLLVSIAVSQAKLGLTADVRSTLGAALRTSQSIDYVINMAPPRIIQRIDAIIDVAEAEAHLGTPERAAAAFALARQLTDSIDREKWLPDPFSDVLSAQRHWRAYAFAAIASGQSKVGLVQDANMTIELAMPLAQALDDRVPPNQPGQSEVLSLIVSARVNAGHMSAAEHLVPLIRQDGWLTKVIEAFAQTGRIDEALHLALLVNDERERALSLHAVADGLSRAEDLPRIAAVAGAIRDSYLRAYAIGAVAQAQARIGLRSDAGVTVDQLAKMVAVIDQGRSHDHTIEEVVEQFCAVAQLLSDL